jgi:putative membrane protein
MTYSVRGFQDLISIGDWSFLVKQVMILLGYLVGMAIVKWIVAVVRDRKQFSPDAVTAHG